MSILDAEYAYDILDIQMCIRDRINPNDIEIVFSRNLPANEVELAQVVNTLNGMVTDKTLLGLLPFVQDVEAEVEELKQQKKQALKTQKQAFAVSANTPLEGEAKDEE